MKYPAKNSPDYSFAKSSMKGIPWQLRRGSENENTTSAFSACKNNSGSGSDGTYRLMSNTQWQTVARNAESVAQNWSLPITGYEQDSTYYSMYRTYGPLQVYQWGATYLARGHIDGGYSQDSPSSFLESSTDDDPYYLTLNKETDPIGYSYAHQSYIEYGGTKKTSGWEQRRTRILTNGEVVWDFGGNIFHWVSDDYSSLGITMQLLAQTPYGYNGINSNSTPGSNEFLLIFGPNQRSGRYGYSGEFWMSSSGSLGLTRGGYQHRAAGLFGAFSEVSLDTLYGFRCVYLPASN